MMKTAMRRRRACLLVPFLIVPSLAPSRATAATLAPGDLVVSEFLANPSAQGDTQGEWVELFNTTGRAIDLRGLTLGDDGSDAHRITAPAPVTIAAGAYLTLGRSPSAGIAGRLADYVYDRFRLGNSRDEIVLRDGPRVIWRVDYDGGLALAGRSAELIALGGGGGTYAPTPLALGPGGGDDVGTPGRAGTLALAVAPVPVPASLVLLVSGLAGLVTLRRRVA